MKNAIEEKDDTILSLQSKVKELNSEIEDNKDRLSGLEREDGELADNYRELNRKYKLKNIALEEEDKLNQELEVTSREIKKDYEKLKKKYEESQHKMDSTEQTYGEKHSSLIDQLEDS